MTTLTDNEVTAMQVYAMVKDARGDLQSSDPYGLAEFASMCLNTVIHLGALVERLTEGPKPKVVKGKKGKAS